jgi:hypothetical protein
LVVPDAKKNRRAYADLIYQSALAGNEENVTDEAESGKREKIRATG